MNNKTTWEKVVKWTLPIFIIPTVPVTLPFTTAVSMGVGIAKKGQRFMIPAAPLVGAYVSTKGVYDGLKEAIAGGRVKNLQKLSESRENEVKIASEKISNINDINTRQEKEFLDKIMAKKLEVEQLEYLVGPDCNSIDED